MMGVLGRGSGMIGDVWEGPECLGLFERFGMLSEFKQYKQNVVSFMHLSSFVIDHYWNVCAFWFRFVGDVW